MLKQWFRWLFVLTVVAIAGALLPAPVQARSLREDKVVFGGTYVLPSGETLDGNLTVIAGEAVIQPNARVSGDAKVIGGKLVVRGAVDGNVSLTGGEALIDGRVGGDLTVLGGAARLGKNAAIEGKIHALGGQVQENPFGGPRLVPRPGNDGAPRWGELPGPHWGFEQTTHSPIGMVGLMIWRGFLAFLRALALAVVAALVVLLLESSTGAIARQMEDSALIAGGVGLATMALIPVAMLLLVITLVLIPVAFVLGVAWGLAALWGWIALGLLLGERSAKALGQSWHPVVSAAAGTFVLTLVADGLRIIPCVGWIPGFLAASLGLGAALLTAWEGWQQQRRRSASGAGSAPPANGDTPGNLPPATNSTS